MRLKLCNGKLLMAKVANEIAASEGDLWDWLADGLTNWATQTQIQAHSPRAGNR